ncbi:MAG: VWA domain-containing protein, partial [Candidatus Omnitrophica bacterium]|nr:VWA domain-containing protein [Candidatus Omnitrophota bacterium]
VAEHYSQITGKRFYKYQSHAHSRYTDVAIDVEQDLTGEFRKSVKELYRYLNKNLGGGNVVIEVDEANCAPWMLWILESVLRGEKWIQPIFPGELPFELADDVLIVFTYNPERYAARQAIDERILNRMIIAWMGLPKNTDRPKIIQTFYGILPEEGAEEAAKAVQELSGAQPNLAGKIVNKKHEKMILDYDIDKINSAITNISQIPQQDERSRYKYFIENILQPFLYALTHYDTEGINVEEFLDAVRSLDKTQDMKLLTCIEQIVRIYQRDLISESELFDLSFKLRLAFVDNGYFCSIKNIILNNKLYIQIKWGGKILEMINMPTEGLAELIKDIPDENGNLTAWIKKNGNPQILVVDEDDSESSTLGYFEGSFTVVLKKATLKAFSNTDFTDEEKIKLVALHELGHLFQQKMTRRKSPAGNYEVYSMLFPVIFADRSKEYVKYDLIERIEIVFLNVAKVAENDYYSQAAAAILNGFAIYLNEKHNLRLGRIEFSEPTVIANMNAIFREIKKLSDEQVRQIAKCLYREPEKYLSTAKPGKIKAIITSAGGVEIRDITDEIEEHPEVEVIGSRDMEVSVSQPDKHPEQGRLIRDRKPSMPDANQRSKSNARIDGQMESSEKEIEQDRLKNDALSGYLAKGKGHTEFVYKRMLRALETRKSYIDKKMQRGLRIDPIAFMLKKSKQFVKRIEIPKIESTAISILFDFSGSMAEHKELLAFAVATSSQNLWRLRETAPKHVLYEISYFDDNHHHSISFGDRLTEIRLDRKIVGMANNIGHGGTSLYNALMGALEGNEHDKTKGIKGFVNVREVRACKRKYLILYTDGQDNDIISKDGSYAFSERMEQ